MNVTLERILEFAGNHWMMSSGMLVVAALLIQDFFESAFRKHKVVSPTVAVTLMNDDRTVVIDVREPSEYAEGHIENARHMPLEKVQERAYDLESDKSTPIIVTCQSGTRSPLACRKLTGMGFTHVYEMLGGMQAWEDHKLPISRKRAKK